MSPLFTLNPLVKNLNPAEEAALMGLGESISKFISSLFVNDKSVTIDRLEMLKVEVESTLVEFREIPALLSHQAC